MFSLNFYNIDHVYEFNICNLVFLNLDYEFELNFPYKHKYKE